MSDEWSLAKLRDEVQRLKERCAELDLENKELREELRKAAAPMDKTA